MLLPIALAYFAGLCLAAGPGPFTQRALGTAALGVASLLVLGGSRVRPGRATLVLAAVAACAGAATPPRPLPPWAVRDDVALRGVVESERIAPDARGVVVRITATPDAPASLAGSRIRLPGVVLPMGAHVALRGPFVPQQPYRNHGPHPAWPVARPVAGSLPAGPDRTVELVHVGAFDRAVFGAREHTRAALGATLTPRVAAVAVALVLGDGGVLDPVDQANISGAGLTHVLAVSGTHIAMVGGGFVFAVERLLRRSRRVLEPARLAAALGIPFAFLHAVFAGSVPSALRAAATASLAWALVALGRRPDALEVTAAASLALALPDPTEATRPGFLLSVVATVAVVTAPKPADDSFRATTLAAWSLAWRSAVSTAPIVVHGFGDVPLASLLANLLLVPLGGIALLPLALLHALVAVCSTSLAGPTAALFEPCARAFLEGSAAFGAVDDGVRLPPTTVTQTLVFAAVAALVVARRRPHPAVVALLAAVYGLDELRLRVPRPGRRPLVLDQLDVGQGDAAVLRMPDGRVVLVDFGPDRPDAGVRVVVPFLAAHRIDRVALAVLTHRHPDHYGGLTSTAASVSIERLLEPGETETDASHDELAHGSPDAGALPSRTSPGEAGRRVEALRRVGVRIEHPRTRCGVVERFGRATIEVIAPCPEAPAGFGLNDGSIVLRVRHGEHGFLLTGDIEAAGEASLRRSVVDLRADVLKVPHHGSRTSSSAALLAAIRPRHALVSLGTGNRFAHPHAPTLSALRRVGARIHRTDQHGGLRVVSDGRTLRVEHAVP